MVSIIFYVFGFVIIFVFLFLLVMFWSIVILIKVIVFNLFLVGVVYGVLVFVF